MALDALPVDTAALLTAIVQSSEDAIISADLSGNVTSWNRAAEQLYGYTAGEVLGQPIKRIIPRERHAEEDDVLRRVFAGEFVPTFETVRRRKDGTLVEVALTASPIHGPSGDVIGVSKISRDLADQRRAERLKDKTLAISRQLASIVESSDDAIIGKNLDGIITSWNRAAERMFGFTASEAIGQSIRIIVPADRQDEETSILARLRRGEKIDHFETVRCRKDGSRLSISLTVSPIRDERDVVIGASKIARDISERKGADEAADRAHRRTTFLAHMAKQVSQSLDYTQTLKGIATAAVPGIADWCAVDMTQEDGQILRLAVAHVDEAKIELAKELRRRYEDPRAPYSVPYVIHTATAALVSDISDDMIVQSAHGDEEQVRLIRSLGLRSYMCVPLVTGGRAVGALTFATAESGRRYTEDDLRFAEDIASRAALAVENATAYEQMQRANRLKDEFLATLSHELRTPLNAILGYARIARGGLISGNKLVRALETIERNSTVLTQMVEDILDVSRIVSGKMRLQVQPVDLPLILQESIETLRPAADAKHITLQTLIDPQVEPIAGDPDRIRQIVWNLLSNAVKFTPKGGQIQLQLARINSSVEITVSDTGIGIAPDFLPHIFERFRQAESGTAREHAGLGLGLAIVRNLVEMHGGKVSASSNGPDKGATFRVRLPVTIAYSEAVSEHRVHPRQERSSPLQPLPDLTGTHVVAVDDEPDAVRLLAEILEAAGASVTTASSAATALQIVEASTPDVIIADLGMPIMDGFGLIQRIRQSANQQVRETPAAALTAYARSEDRAKTLQRGFEMHLAKPVDPVELVSAVKALARRRHA
jgi:PAS domain S-box-containing protein